MAKFEMRVIDMMTAAVLEKQATSLAARAANKVWNSNLGGLAIAGGIGAAEHQALKHMIPGAENMSDVGHASAFGLGTILSALFATPLGRRLMMAGRGKANILNAKKPLFGPGRVTADDWNPRTIVGTATPKVLATMAVPVVDNLVRSAGSASSIGEQLEQAAKGISEATGRLAGMSELALEDYVKDRADTAAGKVDPSTLKGALQGGIDRLLGEKGIAGDIATGLKDVAKLKDVGTGALGAAGGYMLGDLGGDLLGSKGKPERNARVKAALKILGASIGGYAGYKYLGNAIQPSPTD